MSKKFITVMIAAILLVTMILGGCAKKETVVTEGAAETETTTTTEKETETTVVEEEPKVELEPVDLTWYFIGSGEVKDAELVNKAISDYVKDKINANVEIICYDWGSYDTKASTMIATGEPADIFFTTSWALNYRTNAQKGAFLPIEDLLAEYGQGIVEALGQEMIDGNKVDGVAYGIPVNKEKAHSQGILFHKDVIERNNIDLSSVKTFADLEPIFKLVKENESENIINNCNIGVSTGSGPMILFDYDYVTGSGTIPGALYSNNDASNTVIFNQFDTPEFKELLKTTREFYLAGYIPADAAQSKNSTVAKEGKAFTTFIQMKPGKGLEQSNENVNWIQVDFTKPVMSNNDINNSMAAISRTSENPERAMMLLNLMYTDKTLIDLVNYGIEGTHYTRIDDNTIEPIADSGYYPAGSIAWQFGNQLLTSLKSNEDPNKWDNFRKFNEEALVLNSLGFVFDASELQTEFSAINNVTGEFLPVLLTGAVDPDEYLPVFLEKLKEAGSDKVIAECQKQYDAFLASK
jgi:putative aldouronate transport system substrate-binding protein